MKSFEIKDTDALNEFLIDHPPYSTSEQGGIIINQGYIIVKYDDGTNNDAKEKIQLLTKRIDENKGKLLSIGIEQALLDVQIKDIEPKGATGDETFMVIKDLYKKEGLKAGEADNMIQQLSNFRTARFTNSKEIERLNHINEVMRKMIDEAKMQS